MSEVENQEEIKKEKEKQNPEKDESMSEKKVDGIFDFFMKLFFYQGLVVFLPFFIINIANYSPNILNDSNISTTVTYGLIFMAVLISMDIFGIQSLYLDRISRLITAIAAFLGAMITIFLLIVTNEGWSDHNSRLIGASMAVIMMYQFLGWFFIRAERGLTKKRGKPEFATTFLALLVCSGMYILEYFLNGAVLVIMIISFLIYPVCITLWGRLKVVPRIKPKQITKRYKRATLYNFVIDIVKAFSVILLIIVIMYNGDVVLFPDQTGGDPYLWVRNLALLTVVATTAMIIYSKFQKTFHGLFVIIVILLLGILQYLLVNFFDIKSWWVITTINGFTFAGVYYFIEQKMDQSDNIRALPGSFYMLLFMVVMFSIIFRVDAQNNQWLENIKLLFSLLGIAYIIGYIREAPKQKSIRIRI
jgi:hypothetical protein